MVAQNVHFTNQVCLHPFWEKNIFKYKVASSKSSLFANSAHESSVLVKTEHLRDPIPLSFCRICPELHGKGQTVKDWKNLCHQPIVLPLKERKFSNTASFSL
jgi:hypothetical protein